MNPLAWLAGGLMKRASAKASTTNGSRSSGAETGKPSRPTSPEIDGAALLVQLDEMMKQNAHALAMGQAQMRSQLGDAWQEPEDVGIKWNSPTTVTVGSRGGGLGKLAVGAALLAGGVGLGAGIPWLLGKLSAPAAAAPAAGVDTDTLYQLGLGAPDVPR